MGNICPSAVSRINSAEDNSHTFSKLLLYNSIKQSRGSAGPGNAAEGCSPRIDHSPWDTKGSRASDLENEAGETTNLETVASIYHEGEKTARESVNARAAVFALMHQRKEEEFVFTAIYRQEWCLWHSSCSQEIGDTLTFSQLSWSAA